MKAIMMTAIGNPDVLELRDIEEPEISTATQIKVRLKAAGVNPVDTKIRRNGLLFDNPLPAVLGCDGAGEVVETGSAVSQFKPGDKVWFCHGGLGREQGNYAEYTVIDQRWASLMPQTSSFIEAAAIAAGTDYCVGRIVRSWWTAIRTNRADPCRSGRRRPCRDTVGKIKRRPSDYHREF
ncbi:MAG: alcohol dehydrogenase catalytic domain-containing protein [Methylobacter sp.]